MGIKIVQDGLLYSLIIHRPSKHESMILVTSAKIGFKAYLFSDVYLSETYTRRLNASVAELIRTGTARFTLSKELRSVPAKLKECLHLISTELRSFEAWESECKEKFEILKAETLQEEQQYYNKIEDIIQAELSC